MHSRVIVAGGGGAAGYDEQEIPGCFWGGNCGENQQTNSRERRSNGGTQIAGGSRTDKSAESGSFGQGGYGIGTWVTGGGVGMEEVRAIVEMLLAEVAWYSQKTHLKYRKKEAKQILQNGFWIQNITYLMQKQLMEIRKSQAMMGKSQI